MSIQETFIDGMIPVSNRFAELTAQFLKEALIEKGKQASGTLVKSVNAKVRTDGKKAVIEVFAEDYLRYVDKGRRPGKHPPIKPLKEWVALKGMETSAAYAIANKIAAKGIPATPVVNPTVKKVEESFGSEYERELEKILGAVLVNDVFSKTNTKGMILPKSLTV